ncbi:MAG: BatD family protein, partial [Spirochaetaceae bacterium]|nr:BatD family protein [Spirochaetaceae bacterium]
MKYLLSICLLVLSLFPLAGQSVRASVESSEVYLGQPFEYRIIIEGTTDAQVPELGTLEGITIRYKGASTSMVSSFGGGSSSSSKTITYTWSFTPLKKGTLIIPSFSIEVDGKVLKTASGTITVKSPEPIEGFHLFLETDKKEYWEGEPIILTIKWLFSSSVSNPVFNIPFLNSQLFTTESQVPPPGNDVFKLNIDGLDVLAMQTAEIYKGQQYSSLIFGLKLLPEKSGPVKLGPITLAFDSAERSSGFRTSYKSSVIPSNQLDIEIRELPSLSDYTQNSPVILSDGPLQIKASANPQRVHIGDPLTYIISVLQSVSPESIELPPLNFYEEMEKSFSIPQRRSPGKVEGDQVIFSQTIRVKNGEVDKIPELQLQYFNIQSGKLETALIPFVELEVLETEVITSANLESTGYTVNESDDKNELVSNDEGLLYNFSTEKLLKRFDRDRKSVLKNPLYLLFFLIPLVVYSALVIYKYRAYLLSLFRFRRESSDFTRIYNELINAKEIDQQVLRKA